MVAEAGIWSVVETGTVSTAWAGSSMLMGAEVGLVAGNELVVWA